MTALVERARLPLAERERASAGLFDVECGRIARACQEVAERFARGGRLIALGVTPAERSDVRHVTVEFVHPVIVGKRALPAIGLARPRDIESIARPGDVAIGFGADRETVAALALARGRGCLTIGTERGVDADWPFAAPSDDPLVRQELIETLYHVLWELVHVFFEHRGRTHDPGAAGFLYPFLTEREHDVDSVLADVARSVQMKAAETTELRERTLSAGWEELTAAAAALRARFDAGGQLLALGNGGSATDAMDLVADLRARGRPALDLTEDPSILTAIANDIGTDAIFARQVIAYGGDRDALVALSTSGGSSNVIAALAEARRRNLVTIAFVGYDGGQVAAGRLADHVIVTPSQHIPRIQEAQATAYHALVELVGG